LFLTALGLGRLPPPPADPAIAFVRTGPKKAVVVMNADGSNQTSIVSGVYALGVSWSPSGGSLAYLVDTGNGSELRRIDVTLGNGVPKGSNPLVLVPAPSRSDSPAWSPLGDRIAFAQYGVGPGGRISAVDALGGPLQTLYDAPPGNAVRDVTWSANGSRIAFQEIDAAGIRSIKILELATSTLSTAFVSPGPEHLDDLDWARSGVNQIAFEAYDPNSTVRRIYVLDLAASTIVPVIDGSSASWSPDNSEILFSQAGKVKAIRLVTRSVRTLATNSAVLPDWRTSP
jgi:Tol biopolymer transport system component